MFGLGYVELLVLGGAGLLVVLVVVFFVLRTVGGKKKFDPDAGLDEDLSEFPPAPRAGTHQLMFEGQPVRIRLVVLAPAGRSVELKPSMAEGLLESVMPGLGSVAQLDKPRVRVWPAQLSQEGFAATFFRHVLRPEPKNKPSKWILIAGPARSGARVILVGLAVDSGQPSGRGWVTMKPEQWPDRLRVQISR